LRPDTNVVQAVKVPEEEEEGPSGGGILSLGSGSKDGSKDGEDGGGAFNPYSPEGVQKLIDQAQGAATNMEKRNKQLEKFVGDQK
jgi:hypothetical protein